MFDSLPCPTSQSNLQNYRANTQDSHGKGKAGLFFLFFWIVDEGVLSRETQTVVGGTPLSNSTTKLHEGLKYLITGRTRAAATRAASAIAWCAVDRPA